MDKLSNEQFSEQLSRYGSRLLKGALDIEVKVNDVFINIRVGRGSKYASKRVCRNGYDKGYLWKALVNDAVIEYREKYV
jgi:hypothetical protein